MHSFTVYNIIAKSRGEESLINKLIGPHTYCRDKSDEITYYGRTVFDVNTLFF